MRVKLNEAPFYLDEESVQWVKTTVHHMSLEEQLYQLIYWVPKTPLQTPKHYNRPIGGVYQPRQSKERLYHQNKQWQRHQPLPLFIGANVQAGSCDLVEEGSFIAAPMKVCATQDEREAYELGSLNAIESSAMGINQFFAPVIDQITPMQAKDEDERQSLWTDHLPLMKKMMLSYLQGLSDNNILGMACHFPTYRLDRYKTRAEWSEYEGMIYAYLFEHDIPMVLLNKEWFDKMVHHEKTLFDDSYYLLRQEMKFQGVVLSPLLTKEDDDLSYAEAIKMGCDMVMTQDVPGALAALKEGLKEHVFSLEDLYNAVLRIVGLKAKLGFGEDIPFLVACDKKTQLQKIHPKKHYLLQDRIADKAITLLRDDSNLLPLSKNQAICIVPVDEDDQAIAEQFVQLWQDPAVTLGQRGQERNNPQMVYFLIHSTHHALPDLSQRDIVVTCQLPSHHHHAPTEVITYDAHRDTLAILVDKLTGITSFKGTLPFTSHE